MEYDKLLDNLYKNLPEKKTSGERFEMPLLEVGMVGTRTVIKNFEVICQKLRRTPVEVSKYLFKELAIPGSYAGGVLTLNTRVNFRLMNEKFTDYVKTHVICKVCGRPDTHIMEVDRGLKNLICEACGARTPILK